MHNIYLDNAATTFPKPQHVTQSVSDCLCNYAANPKRGKNPLVKVANEQLEQARNSLANHLGCRSEQLVFVPSATYGINQVLQGFPFEQGNTIFISPFEHNSVARPVESLKCYSDIQVYHLPINNKFEFDIEETRRWFASRPPALVAITHASNVTGDLLPIKPVIDLTHEFGGKVLVDASQTVGLYTPRFTDYDYDYLAFSSHKGIHGMPGSGGLFIKSNAELLRPLVYGGTGSQSEELCMPNCLPERFEPGTHSLPSIISMKAGIEWIDQTGPDKIRAVVQRLCVQLLDGINDIPGLRVIGHISPIGNVGIVSFVAEWISPQEISSILDAAGISVRCGLHCAPMAHEILGTIPVGTVRVSPSYFNSQGDIEYLLSLLTLI